MCSLRRAPSPWIFPIVFCTRPLDTRLWQPLLTDQWRVVADSEFDRHLMPAQFEVHDGCSAVNCLGRSYAQLLCCAMTQLPVTPLHSRGRPACCSCWGSPSRQTCHGSITPARLTNGLPHPATPRSLRVASSRSMQSARQPRRGRTLRMKQCRSSVFIHVHTVVVLTAIA